MRVRHALRLLLMVLAGTLALTLLVSVLALRGPAPGARAADLGLPSLPPSEQGGRTVPEGIAVNPNTNLIYAANFESSNVSVITAVANGRRHHSGPRVIQWA